MVPPALPTVWIVLAYGCAEQVSRWRSCSESSEGDGWVAGAWLGPRPSSAVVQAPATVRAAAKARATRLRGHFVIDYSRWR
jgi:hypothetical protein